MIISTLIDSVMQILSMLLNIYVWIIVIHSLILLVQPTFRHPIMHFFEKLTSPLYSKIRRVIPTVYNSIDFTPLIVVIGLKFIDLFLIRLLLQSF